MNNVQIAHMASIAAGSADLERVINSVVDAGEDVKRGPYFVMLKMIEVFGDEMDSFPVPNSEGGNNPDKMSIMVDGTEKKTSFYAELYKQLPMGAAITERLTELAKYKDDPGLSNMRPSDIAAEKKRLENRRTQGRRVIKSAVSIYLQMQALDEYDGVSVDFLTERDAKGEETISKSIAFIHIADVSDMPKSASNFRVLSVSQFVALDPKEAAEKGGGFERLIATAGRGKKESTKEERKALTFDSLDATMADLNNFLDTVSQDKKMQGRLWQLIGKASGDEFLLSAHGVYQELDKIFSKPEIQDRVNKLEVGMAKAA